jgi:hypothetical protein
MANLSTLQKHKSPRKRLNESKKKPLPKGTLPGFFPQIPEVAQLAKCQH